MTGIGPMALLGSGEFEPWSAPVERELMTRASGDGTVAIVPLASAPEGRTYHDWADRGLRHFADLGIPARTIEVRSGSDAHLSDLVRQVSTVSAVFLSGGNPAFLARVLRGTPFWRAVLEALERGAAYLGCSAGACVAGEFAPDSVTEHVWRDRWMPGLGLLPNVWVVPHFDDLSADGVDARRYFLANVPPEGIALGLDERTLVWTFDGRWRTHGDGSATLVRGGGAVRFVAGQSFTFQEELPADGAGVELACALDALPSGAGAIALLSSEQFSAGSRPVDEEVLLRSGPRVGVFVTGEPPEAAAIAERALEHYRDLDVTGRIVRTAKDLRGVDCLFLAGGDPRNLMASLAASGVGSGALGRWRRGMALAGSSAGAMVLCAHCLYPEGDAAVPTRWGAGLGPLRGVALGVHASSRSDGWLAKVAGNAPVPVVAMEDGAALLLEPARSPRVLGGEVALAG
ncbi:MAG TPA: Type 1 glutamine amidotransferase-like domain-containing protein [Actinomycetota bacterium]|nr:Type 1 glutamine amidotransferase-like domain-containing protein [Actinomycetota bacterium]